MIISILIMSGAFLELLFAIAFYFWLRSLSAKTLTPLPKAQQDSTWVLLSVRGFDPSLESTICGLLEQDFADYQVCATVDHRTDPAWKAIEEIRNRHPNGDRLIIRELETPLETCSLKCCAVAEATEYVLESRPETKRIVLVDSDVNLHPTMLAEVTGPLVDPMIGVVSGNQWFEPQPSASIASFVRSMWNAGALLLTVYFQNPWAGTFAMRAETIRDSDLTTTWRTAAVDDGPIKSELKKLGLKSVVVPALIMVNRDDCTWSYVSRWMSRILTWSRIHEPSFFTTQFNVVLTDALILATIATLVWGCFIGSVMTIAWTLIALVTSGIFLVLAYVMIRKSVAENSHSSTACFEPISLAKGFGLLLLVLPTQWIYTSACWSAITAKKVAWRGIKYTINGRSLRMNGYRPFSETSTERSNVSI